MDNRKKDTQRFKTHLSGYVRVPLSEIGDAISIAVAQELEDAYLEIDRLNKKVAKLESRLYENQKIKEGMQRIKEFLEPYRTN